MSGISTNEREWQGEVLGWFKERLPNDPINEASQEIGVEGLFLDIILWRNRSAQAAVVACELKTVETSVRDPELLLKGNTKAKNLNAKLLLTWNMVEAFVWAVRDVAPPEELWSYDPISVSSGKTMHKDTTLSITTICRTLNISRATFYRYLSLSAKLGRSL